MGKALMVNGAAVTNHLNDQRQDIFFPDENTTTLDRLGACAEIGGGSVIAAAAATEVFAGTLVTAFSTEGLIGTTAVASGVWQLNPWQRGREIHRILGENLSSNFPTIDRFFKGVATSIKSIDLSASSYQNINTLTSTVTSYIDKLNNFKGASWAGVTVTEAQITEKVLELAIPSSGWSQAQWDALIQLQEYAAELDVLLKIVQIP